MDIVIIGAQKAGTSWLFSMLRQQPRVCYAYQKEIHYFDKIDNERFEFERYRRYVFKKQKHKLSTQQNTRFQHYLEYCLDPKHAFTDEWYKNIFLRKNKNIKLLKKHAEVKFLDATPSYMAMTANGVAHMARVLPDIEPLLVVRDPLRRMISGTSMRIARSQNRKIITDDWIINMINEHQVALGSYSTALPLFRNNFKNLNIIEFKRIPDDPLGVLTEIEIKYDLDKIEYKNIEKKSNSKTGIVTLSDNVLNHIASVCEIEYDYLRAEFGKDFLKQI
jgi:hypothetical protein